MYHAACKVEFQPFNRSYSQLTFFNVFQKNFDVSCEYDRWVVQTQLFKLRDTLDTLIGRACAMFQLKYGVCELRIYDMVVDTYRSSTSFTEGRPRIFIKKLKNVS